MKPADEEDKQRIPFKLSFIDKNLPGRSNIRIDKPVNLPHVVTPKFYVKYWRDELHEELVEKHLDRLKICGPREKYKDAITENQKYGWHQVQFTDTESRRDRRLNFHKRTDIIVREHLMNYAKIR